MITLVILIVSGIAAAVFATQNTITTSITFGENTFNNIPVYLIALGALLVGIVVSYIISLFKSIPTLLSMRGKDGTLASAKKEINELSKEVHQLEIENTKLRTQLGEDEKDDNSL